MKKMQGLLATLAWLGIEACSANSGESGMKTVEFKLLAQGTQSGIESQRFEVIRDEVAFRSAWEAHAHAVTPTLGPPNVDFHTAMVIAAFAGTKSSGGYRLDITKISQDHDRLEVTLLLTQPDADCFVSEAMTQPYVVATTPRSSQSVHFTLSTKLAKCGQ